MSATTPDRPPVEQPASDAPGGRSLPLDDLPAEVTELAAPLAQVVMPAGQRAVYPGRWEHPAELTIEHDAVRAALRADQSGQKASTPPLTIKNITAQLNELHNLIGNDHGHY